jgi:hypothetical protein
MVLAAAASAGRSVSGAHRLAPGGEIACGEGSGHRATGRRPVTLPPGLQNRACPALGPVPDSVVA